MKWQRILVQLLLACVGASRMAAQCPGGAAPSNNTTSATVSLCMSVKDVLRLTVSASGTSLGNPANQNYGALTNYSTSATPLTVIGPDISVTANRAYEVSLSTSTSTFGPSGVNKPVGDVEWSTTGVFAPLSTTPAVLLTGNGASSTTPVVLSFRSRWAFERDKPGNYSTTVVITLSAK